MRNLKRLLLFPLLCLLFMACQPKAEGDEAHLRQQILDHGQTLRDAFAAEDLEKIKSLHHPEVQKALGYTDLKNGRAEVMAGIEETFKNYSLVFVKNEVEHILIKENIAIEQSQFAIKGTPKGEGQPFVFKGRTLVTYVRYAESATGWATIREIIQVATE